MLPFNSLEEAAASLGRPLTLAELLWFRCTATTPDYLIYAFILFLSFCVVFLCPLPLIVIEAMSPRLIYKYKIQALTTPISLVLQGYKGMLITFLTALAPIGLMSLPTYKLLGIRAGLPLPSLWEMAAQLLVYFLVEDYGNYWTHRLMHRPWAYDKFHRVHHEFSAPIGISASYAHWVDILLQGLPTIAGPAIVPCHIVTLCAWFVLRQIESIETHCGYDFPWSPAKIIPFYGGAEFHDYHHFVGRSQNNFASTFTYCDYIYGTDKGYQIHKAACLAKMNKAGQPLEGNVLKHCTPSHDMKHQ